MGLIYIDNGGKDISINNGNFGKDGRHQAIIVTENNKTHFDIAHNQSQIVVDFAELIEIADSIKFSHRNGRRTNASTIQKKMDNKKKKIDKMNKNC